MSTLWKVVYHDFSQWACVAQDIDGNFMRIDNSKKMCFSDAVEMFVSIPGTTFQNDGFYPLAWWKSGKIVFHPDCSLNYIIAIRKAIKRLEKEV